MEITTKELMAVARDLVGRNDTAFPTAREIRAASGNRGSSLRASQALTAIRVERGINPHLRAGLPSDFLAELDAPPATVAPAWDDVAGFPKTALDLFKNAIVIAGATAEREWADIGSARRAESDQWKADTKLLATQVQDTATELDDVRRSGREAEARHVAALSALREENGVLRKEVEFGQRDVVRVTEIGRRLQQELDAAREALQKETERCRLAETRAASLEATLAGRAIEIAELKTKVATGVSQTRVRRQRKLTSTQ